MTNEIVRTISQTDLEGQTSPQEKGNGMVQKTRQIFRTIFPKNGMTDREKRNLEEDMTFLVGKPYDSNRGTFR